MNNATTALIDAAFEMSAATKKGYPVEGTPEFFALTDVAHRLECACMAYKQIRQASVVEKGTEGEWIEAAMYEILTDLFRPLNEANARGWSPRKEDVARLKAIILRHAAPLPGLSAVVDGGRDKERLDWLDSKEGLTCINEIESPGCFGGEGWGVHIEVSGQTTLLPLRPTFRAAIDAAMSAVASTEVRQGEKGV